MGQAVGWRLVLSRKGFDSDFGGRPSPILPDGQMLSLPSPIRGATSATPTAALQTASATWSCCSGSASRRSVSQRPNGHLRNQGIGPGDLFLFFGLFSPTTQLPDGRLRFAGQRDWIHVLWGWLEVDRVLPVTDELLTELPWAGDHPHWRARHLDRYRRHNTLYVARQHSTLVPGLPGGGLFAEFRPLLRLSRPGSTRSVWRLPMALHPDRTQVPLTGQSPTAWSMEGDSAVLRAAGRGQEFVIGMQDGTRAWIRSVLTAGTHKDAGAGG